jgi:hypothetical protein
VLGLLLLLLLWVLLINIAISGCGHGYGFGDLAVGVGWNVVESGVMEVLYSFEGLQDGLVGWSVLSKQWLWSGAVRRSEQRRRRVERVAVWVGRR